MAQYRCTVSLSGRQSHVYLLERTIFSRISSSGLATNAKSTEDLYDILGVDRKATIKDIKAAYYELSKKYHPDVSNTVTDARRFHEITEAYDTLGNEEKRRAYDEERFRAARIFEDSPSANSDPDLETLREFQRKWNLRRQHYHREQAQKMKSNFDMKNDSEEFESFYKRYRDNVAKARQWDENPDSPGYRSQQGARREHFSDFQKDMMRRQHAKQSSDMFMGYVFTVAALIGGFVLYVSAAR